MWQGHPSVCRALVCTTRKVAAWISLDLFGLLFGIEVISQFGTPKVHGLSSCSPSADCQFLYMFVLYGFIWYNYGPCFETHVYPGLVPDPSVQVAACWGFLADPNGDSETNDLECRACETGSYSLRSRPLVDNIALRCFEAACFKYLFHPFSHLFSHYQYDHYLRYDFAANFEALWACPNLFCLMALGEGKNPGQNFQDPIPNAPNQSSFTGPARFVWLVRLL